MFAVRGFVRIRPMEASHQKFEAKHERALAESIGKARLNVVDYVKNRTWFKRRSGRNSLKDSVQTRVRWGKSTIRVQAFTNKHYARHVEFGTKRHDIPIPARPPGKPLHFFWEKRGIWFTGYHVNHPGTKPPYKFLWRSTSGAAIDFQRDMASRMGRISYSF
jgi:hypothetical protein